MENANFDNVYSECINNVYSGGGGGNGATAPGIKDGGHPRVEITKIKLLLL